MAKRPDEIKKGLEACVAGECNGQGHKCPYRDEGECTSSLTEDALAYIRQLEAQVTRWISVKERLPKEADEVLVFCRNDEITWTNLAHRAGKQWWRTGVPIQCVTHWMPLPEPPEEEA